MEPLAIAASALTVLSPYLAKAGTKAAEEIGEKLPEHARKMWTAITDKFKDKEAAQEAVTDLLDKPDDEMKQIVFKNQLFKMLESDEAFAKSIEKMLRIAKDEAKEQGDNMIINAGSGAVATGHGVAAGAGGVAVKGDVHGSLNLSQSKPQN